VGGATRSTDFLGTSAGHADAFTAIFSPDGRQMLSATRLGGSGDESVLAVAIDGLGGLIVAGQTWSLDFLGAGTTLRSPVGLGEAFVRKLPLARFTGFRNPIMLE